MTVGAPSTWAFAGLRRRFPPGQRAVTYTLHKLASGSYDLRLNGELMGGVVRLSTHQKTWVAELLVDAPPEARPRPFTEVEHTFSSFEELKRWLGGAPVLGPEPRTSPSASPHREAEPGFELGIKKAQ